MEKISVQKPFTVLVAVIVVLALGVVSMMQMTTDLLPEMSLPYLMIITPYPGASPEKVESEVTIPLENALGVVKNVQDVHSTSAENYSMVQLEFVSGTNMDSAMVNVSSAVNQVAAGLPAGVGTPSMLELGMDLFATMYAAVSREGDDVYALSDYVDSKVIPAFQRQNGVASVTAVGLVEKSVQVDLNAEKVARLNDRILERASSALAEAREALDEAQEKVDDGQRELEKQQAQFGETLAEALFGELDTPSSELTEQLQNGIGSLSGRLTELRAEMGAPAGEADSPAELLEGTAADLEDALDSLDDALSGSEELIEDVRELLESVRTLTAQLDQETRALSRAATGAAAEGRSALTVVRNELLPALEKTSEALEKLEETVGALIAQLSALLEQSDEDGGAAAEFPRDQLLALLEQPQVQLLLGQLGISIDDPEAVVDELEELAGDIQRARAMAERLESAAEQLAASGALDQLSADWAELSAAIGALTAASDRAGDAVGRLLTQLSGLMTALESAGRGIELALSDASLAGQLDDVIRELNGILGVVGERTVPSLSSAAERLSVLMGRVRELLDDVSAGEGADRLEDGLDNARQALDTLSDRTEELPALLDSLESAYAGLSQGQLDAAVGFASAATQLTAAQSQLSQAYAQYESARDQALKSANIDALVDAAALSQLIYAQNFAMPAGYIDDRDDSSWLLKVGDEFGDESDIAGALLSDIDGVGTIRISDIADITVIDNAGQSYANLNGGEGIMLCVFKSSTAGTNAVSRACGKAIKSLLEEDPKLSIVKLVDQGKYITLIVNSIVESMALGAALAILVLALFLKDVRPTIIVGVSIPLSVLFALVLMYFTNLSLNMMTLSGLALGIGMLVDNSIVVMENIVRLKSRGMAAPRAAVQGTKQVAGSIIASTLTTISVFLPMIFTTGTVREMLVPLSLSVSYCLVASLLVAVTVIPASASTILSRVEPKPNRLMERVQEKYAVALRWCLKHKVAPLGLSVGLLVLTVAVVLNMGIVVLPEMTSDTVSVTITTPEEDDRKTSYRKMGALMEIMLTVDGIDGIGIMDSGSVLSSVSAFSSRAGSYGSYICYVTLPDGTGSGTVDRIIAELEEKTEGFPAEVDISSSGMMDFSSMFASGLSVNIYGQDPETLASIAAEVAEAVRGVEGFTEVSDGSEDAAATLHLVVDKDRAMEYGLTVAQIYAEIAGRLNTEVTGTSITVDGFEMDVTVRNNTDPLTRENLLDMEFSSNSFGDMSSMLDGDMSSMMDAFGQAEDGEEAEEEAEEDPETEDEKDETVHALREFARLEETRSASGISRENLNRYVTVTAAAEEGYNTTVLSRSVQRELDRIAETLPNGYSIVLGGESEEVNSMVVQMLGLAALGLLFIYLVMVAQFQSLLSPFIILFTVPLAFTGGMLGLLVAGQQMSMLSMMGFLILMGTVVNNGIVFVDYTNQLRLGGLEKWDALVATGQTRMRPILMTTLTTILAMGQMIFGDDMGSQLGGGMAIVIAGGLLYATLMTLFIIPLMYDILYRKAPKVIDVGEDINDVPDDAAEYLAALREEEARKNAEAG